MIAENKPNDSFTTQEEGRRRNKSAEISERTLWGLVTGGVGAVIGYMGGNIVVSKSLRPLIDDVAEQTNAFIRKSAGAGAAEGIGNLAAGSAVHTVQDNITRELVKKHPEKYKLANFLTNYFNGVGSKGVISLGIGAATGLAAAAAYFSLTSDKGKGQAALSQQNGDWQGRTSQENAPAATRGQ